MKNKSNKWPKIRRRVCSSGRVSWQVDLGLVNGKRERRQFPTKEEAETYAQQVRIAWENEGRAAFNLTPSQKAEAEHCFVLMEGSDITLTEAVRYCLGHHRRRKQSKPVAEVVASLLKEKGSSSSLRPTYVQKVRGFLDTFSNAFGERLFSDLTLDDLKLVCSDPSFFPSSRKKQLTHLKPKTILNRIGMLTDLYAHAILNGWADENLASRIRKPDKIEKEPGFLLVEQGSRLLAHAAEFGLLPYVALGLFTGIRRCELLQLDWTAVKAVDREIVIAAHIAKMGSRRVIPFINDALWSWLALCRCESGPIVDAKQFEKNFRRLRKKAGIEKWPHNAVRHSFASYHLAMYKDPVRTAYVLGHNSSTQVLNNHYKGLVSTAEAERYWKLSPDSVVIDCNRLRLAA